MPLTLQFAYTGPVSLPNEADLRTWAAIALEDQSPDDVLIRITNTAESQALNQQYRNINRPTNVLSFPFEPPPGLPNNHLGDLVICAPIVATEAATQHKPPQAHWAHLVIHGILHLRGYDHQNDAEAHVMEAIETRLLQQLGFANPYDTAPVVCPG